MTIRRIAALFLSLTMGAGMWGCGAAAGLPDNQAAFNDDANADADADADAGADSDAQVVAPSRDPSITEVENAFVLSVPIVGESLAADAAGHFTAMTASLSSPSWGIGDFSFDVAGLHWLPSVKSVLTDAAGRGGLVRNAFLPLAAVGKGPVVGNLADFQPAPGMGTVGVLPIVFITTDIEGFPASGAAIEVELWSQQAGCANCPFGQPIRFHRQTAPLISSIEIRTLREAGLWNDRLIAVIAKSAVWWAESETSPSRVRNWMILKPTGGEAGQVRCLTSSGEWPE